MLIQVNNNNKLSEAERALLSSLLSQERAELEHIVTNSINAECHSYPQKLELVNNIIKKLIK